MAPAGPLPDGGTNGSSVNGAVTVDAEGGAVGGVGTNGDGGDGGGGRTGGLVVSPGSLLGLLLSARDKATGQLSLSDENVRRVGLRGHALGVPRHLGMELLAECP